MNVMQDFRYFFQKQVMFSIFKRKKENTIWLRLWFKNFEKENEESFEKW